MDTTPNHSTNMFLDAIVSVLGDSEISPPVFRYSRSGAPQFFGYSTGSRPNSVNETIKD